MNKPSSTSNEVQHMGDLVVIYDPELDIAAVVDTENQVGWGPAMIGEGAREILGAFIDSTPFDLSEVDTYSARRHFRSFLELAGANTAALDGTSSESEVGPASPTTMDEGALAVREATESRGEPPAQQPADTDTTPSEVPQTRAMICPNCNGDKVIVFGDGSEPQECGMCEGRGYVPAFA